MAFCQISHVYQGIDIPLFAGVDMSAHVSTAIEVMLYYEKKDQDP